MHCGHRIGRKRCVNASVVYFRGMEAAQRPNPLNSLSEFLVEHESCGEGFDVAHPGGIGNGHISMTCRGCGQTFDYSLDTIEVEREIEFTPTTIAAGAPPIADGPPPAKGENGGRKDGDSGKPSHRSRDRVLIGTLLVFAIGALAFAAIRLGGDRSSSSGESTTPAPPTAQGKKPAAEDSGGKQAPEGRAEPSSKPAKVKLVGTAQYTLSVPGAWTTTDFSGGKLYAPPGSEAGSVLVFSEQNPGLDSREMTERTAEYLSSTAPGGSIQAPRPLRVGGVPGFELRDSGADGTQVARGVFSDPYRFLVIATVTKAASPVLRRDVRRAFLSFKGR